MPLDTSADSLVAGAISVAFWWTVLSPLALLALLVLGASHPRLRATLTLVVLVPPLLVLLPVTVMGTGRPPLVSGAAAALEAAGVALAATALVRARNRRDGGARSTAAAIALGIVGGMVGSGALVWALFR